MLSWRCLLKRITRSVSYLFEKVIGRHGSIRTAEARVYKTDKLHGRIMSIKSLGYGNHPLFSALFQRASPVKQAEQAFQKRSIEFKSLLNIPANDTLSIKFWQRRIPGVRS